MRRAIVSQKARNRIPILGIHIKCHSDLPAGSHTIRTSIVKNSLAAYSQSQTPRVQSVIERARAQRDIRIPNDDKVRCHDLPPSLRTFQFTPITRSRKHQYKGHFKKETMTSHTRPSLTCSRGGETVVPIC